MWYLTGFLVPTGTPAPQRGYAFQARLAVECENHFHPRHDLSARHSDKWDRQVADLHYADTPAYATGHGVSADWTVKDGVCTQVRTSWIGSAEVEATRPRPVERVELSMRRLGELADGPEARDALQPLVGEYRSWIDARAKESAGLEEQDRATAGRLLAKARNAADRMARGVAVLAGNPDALDAFRMANRAVQRALTRRIGVEDPEWRPFQLAFLLLNLPGMADPCDQDRETVDLLFFPAGGGKTEAYLGLAAFAMVYRRLRNPAVGGRAGAGVSVIMRYTLRLLTLDQLSRAASLVCALELERAASPDRYGGCPSRSGSGWGRRPLRTGWAGRATRETRRAGRPCSTRRTRGRDRLRYRSRVVPGAARGSLRSRSRCDRMQTAPATFGSPAPTSSAISRASGCSRSSPWTSPSTGPPFAPPAGRLPDGDPPRTPEAAAD